MRFVTCHAGWAYLWFAMTACRAEPVEPAPPPAGDDLVIAPPGARGARAAGTEGAPPAPAAGEQAEPGSEEEKDPEPEEEVDAGADPDGGHSPEATPGVTL